VELALDAEILEEEQDAHVHAVLPVIQEYNVADNYHAGNILI
jgi:hypothetical protein